MTGVDIMLNITNNNTNCESFEIPFIELMVINASNITAVKELLMSFDNNQWLKEANELVLKKLMSWKENK